jgi:low affinity Fe/Cu permease
MLAYNRPEERKRMHEGFRKFAHRISTLAGTAWAFMIAVGVILVWGVTGPMFHYSDTWQLVINTGTTVVTFLMVFLIQNTQNRDAHAIHLKLDELIRVSQARNTLLALEELTDDELEALQREFETLRDRRSSGALEAARKAKSPDEA